MSRIDNFKYSSWDFKIFFSCSNGLNSEAIKFLDEENYYSAMELLREASKLDPDNKEIMRSMQILSKIKQ